MCIGFPFNVYNITRYVKTCNLVGIIALYINHVTNPYNKIFLLIGCRGWPQMAMIRYEEAQSPRRTVLSDKKKILQ